MEKFWERIENIKLYKALSSHKLLGKLFNREMISYLFFGACTTVVSLVSFYIANKIFGAVGWQGIFNLVDKSKNYAYIDSNVISFICAVIFAFVTNKLYVFNSKTRDFSTVAKELISFMGARISTFIVDTAMMYLFVTLMRMNEMIAKIIVQVVVVILNYVLSKLFVFKKGETKEKKTNEN